MKINFYLDWTLTRSETEFWLNNFSTIDDWIFLGVIWTHIDNTLSNVRLTDTHHIHNISSSAQISISIYHLIHWRFLHMNWGFKMHDLPILAVIFLTLIRTPFYTFPTSKGRKWKGFHFYRGNDRNLKTINTKHSEKSNPFLWFFFIFGFYFYRKWQVLKGESSSAKWQAA